jgi:DNA repair protein RecO (recombination protein O)
MEWKDEGIIIGTRKHGETSLIVEIMTRRHGRHLGIVRGGRSRKKQPFMQPGNSVEATWRARLDEHLGTWSIEATELRTARLMETPIGIFGIQLLASHLRLMPERDAHEHLHEALKVILSHLQEASIAAVLMIKFELALLDDLGFGLDLTKCAVTGSRDRLTHVSPKTGRAVCLESAAPWVDKLLVLPAFLTGFRNEDHPNLADIDAGFLLTGYFLDRHVYHPRGQKTPLDRNSFIKAIAKNWKNEFG